MPTKFLVLRGGVFWVWGGGEVPILFFHGRGDFSEGWMPKSLSVWADLRPRSRIAYKDGCL